MVRLISKIRISPFSLQYSFSRRKVCKPIVRTGVFQDIFVAANWIIEICFIKIIILNIRILERVIQVFYYYCYIFLIFYFGKLGWFWQKPLPLAGPSWQSLCIAWGVYCRRWWWTLPEINVMNTMQVIYFCRFAWRIRSKCTINDKSNKTSHEIDCLDLLIQFSHELKRVTERLVVHKNSPFASILYFYHQAESLAR